jgi:hypothetical protein
MSLTAITWVVIYSGGLILSVVHPFYPFVSYLVFYYAPPQLNYWGNPLPDLRYSLTASLAMLASAVFLNSSLERVKSERNAASFWLVLFGLNTIIVTIWALNSTRSWIYTTLVLKLVLLYLLIPAAVRVPAQFDAFGAVHIAGASYWGYKAYTNPHRKAGRLADVGGPDTQNDNQAAGHLNTVIPFVALYMLTEKRKIRRALYAVGGAFVVNTFVLCNSRGATLGLIAGGMAAVLLAGKGRRKKLIGVGILGALGLLFLADPEFIARQQTTAEHADNSAQSRLAMWKGGIEMVKDYPLGGGGRTFHILSPKYIPAVLDKTDAEERSPHNTYIQLATDWGLQGTVLFFGFMFMTLVLLHRVRKRAPDNHWYFYRALTVEVAIIGTMTAAFFSNRLYGESIYWMCALAFALYRMQSTELEAARTEPEQAVVTSMGVPIAVTLDRRSA